MAKHWNGEPEQTAHYYKSSFCANSGCVEVASLPDGSIAVRDSKETGQKRTSLIYTTTEWDAFLDGVKAGEFDSNRLGQNMSEGVNSKVAD